MISKRLKIFIASTICFPLTLGLISCNSDNAVNTSSVATNMKYTITEEAGDSAKLKISNMPTVPFWFPEDLLAWDPSTDKDIEYNKSVVPLRERVSKDKLNPVNSTQNKDFNIVALSIMNASTSGNPSQGSNKFGANTFSFWQYIDKLVYWGGSSGEGIIVPPSADVIDSAHKNGVPVLGTVFFPTTEHGGKAEWVDQFLQKDESGNFPMVDKLIQVCDTLGFDGWFINQETGLTVRENDFIDQSETAKEGAKINQTHAELMQDFIRQFNDKSDYEIMWYDSLTKDGVMDWQNALTDKNDYFLLDADKEEVADSMFLNFWWNTNKLAEKELLKASNEYANSLGIDPYSLYAGIDLQANGTNTKVRWELLEDDNNVPYTSLGLYCPSWTYFSSNSIDEFMDKEERLWVNEFGDPSKGVQTDDESGFRGMSTYAVERSVLDSTPVITNFSMGNGYNYFVNGTKVSSLDWNNRSLADIMPTYRWTIDNGNDNTLKASIDYSRAYYGGNSIRLNGNLKANSPSTIKLFSADLEITDSTKFSTIASSDSPVSLNLILDFDDGTKVEIPGNIKLDGKGVWTTVDYDVSQYSGKTISAISYEIQSDVDLDNTNINFGNMSITDGQKYEISDVLEAKVDDVKFEEDDMYAGVRLSFDASNTDEVDHYEIYKINPDSEKTRTFLGATITNRYFVNALLRDNRTDKTTFEIVAVNKDMKRGSSQTVDITWPDNSKPKANFTASKTIIAPGEEITFNNLSSQVTENVEWTFDGATTSTSTENSPKVKYDKEGTYTVTLKAKNSSGEDVKIMDQLITVTNSAKNFENLSQGKSSEASSFVNSKEAPEFAFDGKLDTKWCATGNPPHNITVDLGQTSLIGEVRLAHAEAGNESPDMNTSDFKIEVSEDGSNFVEVANVKKNSLSNTTHTFKAIPARYVRVTATKPTQGSDSAVRIYEIQVFGISQQ